MAELLEPGTSSESDVQLKKRARRRLVGATALALLAVIVLPMVMDHEPRPAVQDIQVRIPSQDATGLAAKLPGKAVATPLPAAESKPAEPKPEVKPEAKPEPKAEVVAKPEQKPEPKPEPKPAPAPEKKPEPKQEAKPEPKHAEGGNGQWVVQLGAYKDQANVKQLLAKLKGMGVPAYTEAFDSPQGPRTRVRAGPFPSKDAAEKARVAKIKKIGVDGPVAPK